MQQNVNVFIQILDFSPAEIFSSDTEVWDGQTLELRCAIFQNNDDHSGELHMYLCKNGAGIKMDVLTDTQETIFVLENVDKDDSGSYSCVYSKHRHQPWKVTAVGNSIFIHVKGIFRTLFEYILHILFTSMSF